MAQNTHGFQNRYHDDRPVDDEDERLFCDLSEDESGESFLKNKGKSRFNEKKRENDPFFF